MIPIELDFFDTPRAGFALAYDIRSWQAARAFARTQPGDWILLKASRGMRLERVLEAMKEGAR